MIRFVVVGADADGDSPSGEEKAMLRALVPEMYSCALVRLRATDMDQEVKERAIAAVGQLVAHFADYLEVLAFALIKKN